MNPGLVGFWSYNGAGVSRVSFYCLDDGTPVGMTIQGGWVENITMSENNYYTATLDITFDSLNGVTITAPDESALLPLQAPRA